MTSLEELMESERQAVEPKPEDIDRVGRRVMTAVGMGTALGMGAAMVTTAATAQGGATVLSKVAGLLGTKVTVGWALAAVAVGGGATLVAEHVPGTAPPSPSAAFQQSADPGAVAVPTAEEENDDARSETKPTDGEMTAPPAQEQQQARVPTDQRIAESASRTAHEASKSARQPTDTEDRLRRDAKLLSLVTAELNSGNHARALSLMNQKSLAGSPLSAEFAAARAVALCSTGRNAEAAPWVERFRKQSPNSPAARRVRRACGTD